MTGTDGDTGEAEKPSVASAPGRWSDLGPRIASGAVLVILGGGAVVLGGWELALVAVLCVGAMVWELARMTRGDGFDAAIPLGVLAAVVLALNLWVPAPWPLALLLLPSLIGVMTPRRDSGVFAAYALVILLTGLCFVILRETLGLAAVLAILLTVIVSDIAGYFAGRVLGGPKFWPAISPKKTWSGTIAGWIGAALVGAGFWLTGWGGAGLIWILPVIAFAGQMGDIAESAIKRRAGVKDSSQLIPGHGGVMDRFDALAFATIAAAFLQPFLPFLPGSQG
ncbi:MAG: phosphatidate cytidylyltransferase [Rhodobacteraceae bacterium]|jgi:phosphatidate cytidylyltransferase|nr:phosphatidate cytidylyltransferase [Paracoccaceae bacterium]